MHRQGTTLTFAMPQTYLRTNFLERLAHDLRGAASTGGGALDELATQLSGNEGERFAQIARRSLARVLRMSQSLAEAAELERGNVALHVTDNDLHTLISSAVGGAQALENRRGIALTVEGGGTARCDAERLKRAVFELASNAIRAARTKVQASATIHGARVVIAISDDGPGAPPVVPRFTPTGERRGLGLGVAMAADVAALHGGGLTVERLSDLTVVSLSFPC
jgi:signal transduction histidine kinase